MPMLTQFPSPEERPHREPRHWQVPGGGAVQGCQLRAAAGDAEMLGAEVDHQKLDQAREALTPARPRSLPNADPEGLGMATPSWCPAPGWALPISGWDLSWAAGGSLGPVRWDSGGLPASRALEDNAGIRACQEYRPSQLGSLTASSSSKPRAFPMGFPPSCPDGHLFCMCCTAHQADCPL